MSFRMVEPDEEPRCECFYVEARDAMDRDDCPLHYDLVDQADEAAGQEQHHEERKRPEASANEVRKEDAA